MPSPAHHSGHEGEIERVPGGVRTLGLTRSVVLSLLLVETVIANGARAQDCANYDDYPHWLGGGYCGRAPVGVTVSGIHACIANVRMFSSNPNLRVIDISDPTLPEEVVRVELPVAAAGMDIAGDHVYATAGGLKVVSISTGGIVGSLATPDGAVAVAGSYAYVAADSLRVVDVSDPTSPWLASTTYLPFPSPPTQVPALAIAGTHAYVLAEGLGLQVIDISTPTSPVIVGSLVTSGGEITVYGGFTYVATHPGVQVIDVRDPGRPTIVHQVETPGEGGSVAASDCGLVVMEGRLLSIIDIQDPAAATVIATEYTNCDAWDIALEGCYAVAAEWQEVPLDGCFGCSGFEIFDVSSSAASPVIVRSNLLASDQVTGIAIVADHAYVTTADPAEGLSVVDLSEPASPELVASVETQGSVSDIAIAGPHAYLATDLGLEVIDIADPVAPGPIGFAGTPAPASKVTVAGNYAYVGAGGYLYVVEVSEPAAPAIVGSIGGRLPTGGMLIGAAVSGNYAFSTCNTHCGLGRAIFWGLAVIDISDPTAPSSVGGSEEHLTLGLEGDLLVADERVYVTRSTGLSHVFDISEPTSPVFLGSFSAPGNNSFVRTADHVYAAGGGSLHALEISGDSPRYVGHIDFEGAATGAAAGEERMYVTVRDGEDDLVILPMLCGPVPVELVSFAVSSTGGVVTIVWETGVEFDHAGFYIGRSAGGSGPFVRLDRDLIRNAGPGESRYTFTDHTVFPGGVYCYRLVAVDRFGGTQTFSLGSVTVDRVLTAAPVLHQNRPNPFNPSTSIAFELPEAVHVTLRIYDLSGRLVKTLVDDRREAGQHSVVWTGHDRSGSPLASGIYVYRLEAGNRKFSKRLILVK